MDKEEGLFMFVTNTVQQEWGGVSGSLHGDWSLRRIILGELVQHRQKNQCHATAGTLGARHLGSLQVPLLEER